MTDDSTTPSPRKRLWVFVAVLALGCGGIWFARHSHRNVPPRLPVEPAQVVVCIDPGHPSESNSGRTVQHGSTELKMNWLVALQLEKILSKDHRVKVIKTRSIMDQYLRNRQRALIANEAGAALSIHLHCDAGPSHGFTIYYPDKQGHSEGKTGPSPEILKSSYDAAKLLHKGMCVTLAGKIKDRGILGEKFTRIGRINGGLTTSVWSDVPTVTVEMVFLSNAGDAAFIESRHGQQEIAQALAAGIKDFIKPRLEAYDAAARKYQLTSHS